VPTEIDPAEQMRANTCAFFIKFTGLSLAWIVILAVSVGCTADGSGWGVFFKSFFEVLGPVLVLGAAAMIVGGLLGFLFGVPRALATGRPPGEAGNAQPPPSRTATVAANTNLEQISDWLTKIIVGLGLAEISRIKTEIVQLSHVLAPLLGGIPAPGPVAIATLLLFATTGFLWAYFESRTSLMALFR
jgi:hypothetical protein